MTDPLTATLADTLRKWRALGDSTRSRFADWSWADQDNGDERGGGNGGTNPERTIDRYEQRQAASYRLELSTLSNRLIADLHRLNRLVEIAHPDQPRILQHKDMTAAQLIADAWCPSCFRDDGWIEPLGDRYRDRCRRCGDHRANTDRDPTLDELRIMHSRGKRLRQRTA